MYVPYMKESRYVCICKYEVTHVHDHVTQGRAAAEGFSPTLLRAHWIRPEQGSSWSEGILSGGDDTKLKNFKKKKLRFGNFVLILFFWRSGLY